MKGCQFLVEDCTMDGTDYDCEHPTYGAKYGCDRCPMFGRNGNKRQYRLVNFRAISEILPFSDKTATREDDTAAYHGQERAV